MKNLFEVNQVFKEYHIGTRTVAALKGINLDIQEGEYVILFGPSGCGKTTLLNLLAGLDDPTSGEIMFRGEKFSAMSRRNFVQYRREMVGMVFQEFNLVPSMTARENIVLPLVFDNVREDVRSRMAARWLKKFHLEDQQEHHPVELSGGEQQRVAIARAMIATPRILLVDEPTGNLDSESATDVMNIIFDLNKKSKRTVLLVTHNPNYFGFAHRIVQMRDGQIVAELRERAFDQS